MNYDEIDIRLTKKFKSIVARRTWFDIIMNTLTILLYSFGYPLISFHYVYTKIDKGEEVSILAFINLLISITFAFLLLYAWNNTTRLKKIQGLNSSQNREIILQIINRNNWIERRITKTLIVASPSFGFQGFNWGRQFNFLLEENDIYINVISFGRFQISPFHWFADRNMEVQIFKEIKDSIKNKNTYPKITVD